MAQKLRAIQLGPCSHRRLETPYTQRTNIANKADLRTPADTSSIHLPLLQLPRPTIVSSQASAFPLLCSWTEMKQRSSSDHDQHYAAERSSEPASDISELSAILVWGAREVSLSRPGQLISSVAQTLFNNIISARISIWTPRLTKRQELPRLGDKFRSSAK